MLFAAYSFLSAGLVGWLLTRTLLGGAEPRHRMVAALVLAESAFLVSVHLAAGLQLVGITGRVAPSHVALMQALFLVLTVVFCSRSPRNLSQVKPRAAAVPTYLLASAAVICGAYLIGAVNAFGTYIDEWDAVKYHLLLPHHWLLEGSFAISSTTHWSLGMPANGETAMYLFFGSGLDRLAFLAQWPALACLCASAYSLAFSLTRSRDAALSCVLLLVTLPIVYYQTFSGYVDLFGAAFMLGAVALAEATLHESEKKVHHVSLYLISGLACGIALGTKHLYLAFIGPLIAAVATHRFWRCGWSKTAVTAMVGLMLSGILVTSGFWFLRAWLLTGNPMFPLRVAIRLPGPDWVLFPGIGANSINGPNWAMGRFIRSRAEWFIYPWIEDRARAVTNQGYSVDTGVGAGFATFVPLGTAFLAWAAWRYRSDWRLRMWLAGLLFCGLVWWFPLHQTPRFGLVFIFLLVIASAPLFSALGPTRNRVFGIVFTLAVTLTSGILSLDAAAAMANRSSAQVATRADTYRYPTYVDDLPAGATILNLYVPNNFAMAGRRLSNRVVSYLEAPARTPLTEEFLRERGIDYIAGHDTDRWRLEGLPEVRLVHSEHLDGPTASPFQIWKVDPGEDPGPDMQPRGDGQGG